MLYASLAATSVIPGGGGAAAIAAQRASISRTTLVKIEKGDPGVAIGIYATVLFVLGMADRLGDLAAPKNDPVGLLTPSAISPSPRTYVRLPTMVDSAMIDLPISKTSLGIEIRGFPESVLFS
jgi:hypothetical protein